MQRMVIAEAQANPEMAQTFYMAGPHQTRELLKRFFARPEIGAQLHPQVEPEQLPVHLLNCIMGDQLPRLLFETRTPADEDKMHGLSQRMTLFYRSVLRHR
jgi:TetR/AcrR family transcriptional regulator, mexJK operon transcriptional repressor